jgi:hypothetical protein
VQRWPVPTLIFNPLMTHPRTSALQDGSKASSSTASSPDKTVSSLFDNTNAQQKKPVVSDLSDSTDVNYPPSHPPSYTALSADHFSHTLSPVELNTCMGIIGAHEEFLSFQRGEGNGWIQQSRIRLSFKSFAHLWGHASL